MMIAQAARLVNGRLGKLRGRLNAQLAFLQSACYNANLDSMLIYTAQESGSDMKWDSK